MTIRTNTFSAVALVLASLLGVESGQAQVTQTEIIEALRSSDPGLRVSAISAARQVGPENASPALRAALIAGLERELRPERGGHLEIAADMAQLVSKFRDPRAVPALVGALGTYASVRGLAALGEPAAAATIHAAKSEQNVSVLQDALVSLRFMAEGVGQEPLSKRTRKDIVELARQRLEPVQHPTVLRLAIDLAMALDDPELSSIVEAIASDPRKARARIEVTDEHSVQRTVEWARARLAGDPPLPRW
jgi:HEAT repeat protein